MEKAIGNVSIPKTEGIEAAIVSVAKIISAMPAIQHEFIGKALVEIVAQKRMISDSAKLLADELTKKSAELVDDKLTKRQKQILDYMEIGVLYSTEEIAAAIGLKGPRTRQLLNELILLLKSKSQGDIYHESNFYN